MLRADRDVPPQMIDLGAAEEIDADIRGLRGAVDQFGKALENKKRPDERTAEDHFRELGTTLFAKLFAPLRTALGQATLLYLAPDGALNLLPFEALVDEQGNYLVESRRFVYLSSGRDLLRPAAALARGTVVFADPDYDLDAAGRQAGARTLLASLPAAPELGVRGACGRAARQSLGIVEELRRRGDRHRRGCSNGSGHGPVPCIRGRRRWRSGSRRCRRRGCCT